ncbi:MAG: glycosyltransferase family 4 protein [Candidatus Magasanikbacteria bacterium]|nr:glycosyltransferase family 4 protein [Candidatus Magasanikbacteria bacterium]
MKKTLIITLEYPPTIGGIASYVHQLATALDPSQVIVLAPCHLNAATWDAAAPYRVIRKNFFLPRIFWPRWLRLLWHTLWIMRREKVELILVQHVLPVGYVSWVVQKLWHVPYLVFSHGTDFLLCTRNWWKTKLTRIVLKPAVQITVNSQSLRSRFERVFPELTEKTFVLYPCPDKIFFVRPAVEILAAARAEYALEGKKVMLSISRLGEGKGFPHLLALLPDLIKEVPNLVWLIVGGGEKEQYLVREIQKRGLQNIIRLAGEVSHDRLPVYYYLADLFVLLTHPDETRGEEGMGLVFLEASAAGLPIIAGKSGGVEEGILHTETGLVVDSYQPKQVVKSIRDLLREPAFAHRLGAAARERVRVDFQWEHQVKKLEPRLGSIGKV